MWWIKKHLAHPLLACEQALLLRKSREVTRDPHAKGDASVRSSLASRFARAKPLLLAQNDWANCPSYDTKPCRRTSAWEAIRTDTISESILLRPWGPFLESPGTFYGPEIKYSNRTIKNKSTGPG